MVKKGQILEFKELLDAGNEYWTLANEIVLLVVVQLTPLLRYDTTQLIKLCTDIASKRSIDLSQALKNQVNSRLVF